MALVSFPGDVAALTFLFNQHPNVYDDELAVVFMLPNPFKAAAIAGSNEHMSHIGHLLPTTPLWLCFGPHCLSGLPLTSHRCLGHLTPAGVAAAFSSC